jgi:hypothetical protein
LATPDDTELTHDDLIALASDLARENEAVQAKLVEMTSFAEEAVALRVDAERERDEAVQQLQALLNTRVMRAIRPLRVAYGRLRRAFGRPGL